MSKPSRTTWAVLAAGVALLALAAAQPRASEPPAPGPRSPHYVPSGFFDIHVCNWPEPGLFLMALFSTTRFADIQRIEVRGPSGEPMGDLDMSRFRLGHKPGEPEKRVFIRNFPADAHARDGWYSARITLRDGRTEEARDRVILRRLPVATGMVPAPGAENIPLPKELSWSPIPGARHYQVFVKDMWDGEKVILTSKLLSQPRLALPEGLVQPGGFYAWRIHARDVNEDAELGDFNDGSLSAEATFSVRQ